MIRRTLLLVAPLAVAALLLAPVTVQAQSWGRGGWRGGYQSGWGGGYRSGWGGWAGNYPGYSSGWGGYSSPSYYGYSNPGYSSYYYSSPLYGYPSYSYSYPSYYATPSYGSSTTVTVAPASSSYQSFYPSDTTRDSRTAYVRVHVPADAEVWFEGQPTQQRGSDRLFVSPPLKPDTNYSYEIRARWMDNGREVDQTRTARVRAGSEASVDFLAADATPTTTSGARTDEFRGERRDNRSYRSDRVTQERAAPTTGAPLPADRRDRIDNTPRPGVPNNPAAPTGDRRDIANPDRPRTPRTETPPAPSGIDNTRGPQNPRDVNTPPTGATRPGVDTNPNRPATPQTETPTAPPGTNNGGVNRPGGPGSSSSPAGRP